MASDRVSHMRQAFSRVIGMAAAAGVMLSLTPVAQALSLNNPGMAPTAKQARDAAPIEVRGRGGGGGFHGGGFRGGGHAFHGGGFRGGGFRAAAPAFRGGAFHHRPAFSGGGFRHAGPAFARRSFYAPAYYGHRRPVYRHRYLGPRFYGYSGLRYYSYGPRRFCRVIWTYYGPRKICRYRPWHHRHWHHRRHFNVYW